MGTTYSIKAHGMPAALKVDRLSDEIEGILGDLTHLMSTYEEDSQISGFNRAQTTAWQSVSLDMAVVVESALQIGALSGGAFDITIGPLVDLWGFRPTPIHTRIPDEQSIVSLVKEIGYQRINVRQNPPTIRKTRSALRIDLSGIAKGYAVDKVAEHLDGLHVENYLIEIGGEMRAKGASPQGTHWRVALEDPVTDIGAVRRIVELTEHGLATSGDYRNYVEINGRRLSHTIDPRTGWPVDHDLASVSVIHPSAMQADGLATALLVLGPDKAIMLANQHGIAVFFVIRTEGGFTEHVTDAFAPFLTD